jgi:hypothetical protein
VIIDRVMSEEGLSGREAFTRAQSLLRFHYQHVVLFDFLPRICGEDIVRSSFIDGRVCADAPRLARVGSGDSRRGRRGADLSAWVPSTIEVQLG